MRALLPYLAIVLCFGQSCQQEAPPRSEKPVHQVNLPQGSDTSIQVLDAAGFERRLQQQTPMMLIDVRNREEYKNGFIAGALNIPIEDSRFYGQVSPLNRHKPVGLYCDGGQRSEAAAVAMKNIGFQSIYILQDGVLGWKESGRTLEGKGDRR
jgi:rhodanese-related sulfurtransferase